MRINARRFDFVMDFFFLLMNVINAALNEKKTVSIYCNSSRMQPFPCIFDKISTKRKRDEVKSNEKLAQRKIYKCRIVAISLKKSTRGEFNSINI